MSHPAITTLPWPEKTGTRSSFGPCPGASSALTIAELAVGNGLIVVVTPTTSAALELEREIPLFLPKPLEILTLPDWETLPYDNFSPHQDIISERLNALHKLPSMTEGILIVPMTTLMHRTPPSHYIAGNSLVLAVGEALDTESFVRNLSLNGYRSVDTVYEHGEYAIRGALLDIYPMGSPLPYRIDLFDNEVETLRTFDPESQRTIAKVDASGCCPHASFPCTLRPLIGSR